MGIDGPYRFGEFSVAGPFTDTKFWGGVKASLWPVLLEGSMMWFEERRGVYPLPALSEARLVQARRAYHSDLGPHLIRPQVADVGEDAPFVCIFG